jgi:hypothetical protein
MNVYDIHPVADHPLFEGLGLSPDSRRLDSVPKDWRKNPLTWEVNRLAPTWTTPDVEGSVRLFNDYPTVNFRPAFSQRAVDLLRDVLEPNGELLPLRHQLGTYYFYNCTRLVNVIDESKSRKSAGGLPDINGLVFFDDRLDALEIFVDRLAFSYPLCTQRFVNRVQAAGLHGFIFIPHWPLPPGVTYHSERYRLCKLAEKWKPNPITSVDVKGNTIVVRLCCQKRKVSQAESAAAEKVMEHLERVLYDPQQTDADSYFGNVEGSDVVDFEIRIFLSSPDCDRCIEEMMPSLRTLPWPNRFYVVKRRGDIADGQAPEEYVSLI